MNIIKLSAIDSTNDYLKINFLDKTKNDIHVVYTFNQTKGKGQRGNIWNSEPEKNLAFSVAFFPNKFKVENQVGRYTGAEYIQSAAGGHARHRAANV